MRDISCITLLFAISTLAAQGAAVAQGTDPASQPVLPTSIKAFLDSKYPGWTFAKKPKCEEEVGSDVTASMVVGDFNGDGKRDYAVQLAQRQKIVLFEFLTQGTFFVPHVLENHTSADDVGLLLYLGHKGDQGIAVDTLHVKVCGADIGFFYLFTKGKFQKVDEGD